MVHVGFNKWEHTMPFDSTNFDYTKIQPTFDKNNPPKRMSEAIRMAVADVEAQERIGIEYEWGDCSVCTAGAVVRRMDGTCEGASHWGRFGEQWGNVLESLSLLTCPTAFEQDTDFEIYRRAFGRVPVFNFKLTHYGDNPEQFKTDMLALADRLEAEGS